MNQTLISGSGIRLGISRNKPTHLFKKAASIWTSYYDKGTASVENARKTSMDFVVRDFPELSKAMRDAVTGHVSVLMSKTGSKNLKITHIDSNPREWIWRATWE